MTAELHASFEKRYRSGAVISAELSAPVDRFSVTTLFGPSGCGKTTVLRCLAGLEQPELGTIRCRGEIWFDALQRIQRTPQERDVGYLFQEYALFPHLTVSQNIGYGLTAGSKPERRRRIDELVERFGLQGLQNRTVHHISGGQQQRVALARALSRRPRLLLLDEPLSALDAPLREELRLELRRQLAAFGVPTILVTHDRLEALSLSDQVVVMHEGRVQQTGPVDEVFARPRNVAVARSVGIENIFPARVVESHDGSTRLAAGPLEVTAAACGEQSRTAGPQRGDVYACLRADAVSLKPAGSDVPRSVNCWPARITGVVPEGSLVRVTLDCKLGLMALITRTEFQRLNAGPGDALVATFDPADVHVAAT
jgi:molybdate transport system ATP-binding protein